MSRHNLARSYVEREKKQPQYLFSLPLKRQIATMPLVVAELLPEEEKKLAKVEQQTKLGYLYAGRLCIQTAIQKPGKECEKTEWLRRAQYNLEKSVDAEFAEKSRLGATSFEAKKLITQLPHYEWMATKRKLSAPDVVDSVYKNLALVGIEQSKTLDNLYEESRKFGCFTPLVQEDISGLHGQLAETSVLLLLQRYAANHMQDQSFLPIPSLIREEQNHVRDVNPNWDISIYNHLAPSLPVTLPYKVQVKASDFLEHDTYAPDIQVVHVKSDLRLDDDEFLKTHTIVREVWQELTNENASISARLDDRTYLLLEQLDK